MNKKLLALILIICLSLSYNISADDNLQIKTIDIEEIIGFTDIGSTLKNIENQGKTIIESLARKGDELEKKLKELEEKGSAHKNYKKDKESLDLEIKNNTQEINDKSQLVNHVLSSYMEKINGFLSDATNMAIDKENNPNSFVIHKGALIEFPDNAVITDLVKENLIKILDEQKDSISELINMLNLE